jgi:hypothetical protein
MAMITKSTVAGVLGLTVDDISDSVFTWATKQFFILTGLKAAETQKTYRKFVTRSTNVVKLPDHDIKSIDEIKLDGTAVDNLTEFTNYKYNPDTGLLWYGGNFGNSFHALDGEPYSSKGFGADGSFGTGNLVEVTYTLNAYTHTDIHDYLVSLLVVRALSMFTPDKVGQVKSVKIGKFAKQFGSAASNLESYAEVLQAEIMAVKAMILGDDGGLGFDAIC